MDLIGVLRLLWRRRLLVAIGITIATAIAIVTAFSVGAGTLQSRQYDVGVASASVLVDSQSSQVVDLGGEGDGPGLDVASLSRRARLLATLMSSRPLKDQIAARAGVPSRSLIAQVTSAQPDVALVPVTTGTTIRANDPKANILSLQTAETLPIITINAQATSGDGAERLATAAVGELARYMQSIAAADRVPSVRQLVVTPLGPAISGTLKKGPRRLWSVIAFLVVIGAWCAAIVLISSVAGRWRDAADAEAAPTPPGATEPEAEEPRDGRPDLGLVVASERASRTRLARR